MKSPRLLPKLLLAVIFPALSLSAADWPQWRGPHRDGISAETGLLAEWPKEGPKQVWQITDAGAGFGAPAIAGGVVYLISNHGLEEEFVQARSAADGHSLWSARIGKVGNPDQRPSYPAARSTPTIDGANVYALGSDGDLVCLKAADGQPIWKKNLRADFGGEPGTWAYSESPLVDGDKVVCTPGGKDATVVALNKLTGDVIWKAALPDADQAAYASITPSEIDGKKEYVQFLQKGLAGIDGETGKLLWRSDAAVKSSPANIPTPVIDGASVYSATGRGGGALVQIKADPTGALQAEPVYAEMKLPNAIGGAVKLGQYLYGTTSTGLLCVDFTTGKTLWQDRSIGAASVIAADKHLYLHGENGEVALVDAAPAAYRERGRFTPANGPERGQAKAWAYPAISDAKLYIRDGSSVWCYDVKAAP